MAKTKPQAKAQPTKAKAKAQPTKAKAKAKPAKAKPVKPKAKAKPAKVEPVKAKAKAKPVKAKAKAKPVKAKATAKPVKAKPVKTKPVKTKPVKAKPAKAQAKPEKAKAKPAKAKPAKQQPVKAKPADDTATASAARSEAETEKLAKATHARLEETWSAWGAVDPYVISHAINPSLMGGPRWPGMRQAYRVVLAGEAVLIASDGLADPYDPEEGPEDTNGLGLEFFAITDDDVANEGVADAVAKYGATWLHDLVFYMAQFAASHGGIADLLDELDVLTTELSDVKIPESHTERFVNDAGRVGILLSLGHGPLPPRVEGPLGPIRLVQVQLLTLDELDFVLAKGEAGRRELADKLQGQLSRLDRPSVIAPE